MDHELKQRLIGAVVVTALCAIFIPDARSMILSIIAVSWSAS